MQIESQELNEAHLHRQTDLQLENRNVLPPLTIADWWHGGLRYKV